MGYMLYVETPRSTDLVPFAYFSAAATVSTVNAKTDSSSVTFQVDQRTQAQLAATGASGTAMFSAVIVANPTGVTGSFATTSITADRWLVYRASATGATGPSKLWVSLY